VTIIKKIATLPPIPKTSGGLLFHLNSNYNDEQKCFALAVGGGAADGL
jgi:hypothetical protein